MAHSTRFDADYYQRFYGDPRTRVASPASIRRLADFVTAYLQHLQISVRSVLDLGCGLGWWQQALEQRCPRARYLGVEWSDWLCEQHGWTKGSVVDFAPGRTFDLVVCQGVLQYLDDKAASKAIANLARLCTGALYLEALTTRDWQQNCDRSTTDGSVHLRTGEWYRKRLRRHFLDCGGGVFVRKTAGVVTFELEALA